MRLLAWAALAACVSSAPALAAALARRFGIAVVRTGERRRDPTGFPGQYQFEPAARRMWIETGAAPATVQFQLARLYGELAAGVEIERELAAPELTSDAARRLGNRFLGTYLASAIIFPYSAFRADAERLRYDVEALRRIYGASFEQVAHRLVTLRRPGEEGVPFGFLRADPAGRLTKRFPLPGLPLPSAGHACPLWVIYEAFRVPDTIVRQLVQFADGSRYLFVAQAQPRRRTRFGPEHPNGGRAEWCEAGVVRVQPLRRWRRWCGWQVPEQPEASSVGLRHPW